MPSATPDTVRQQIAARRVDALYLLHGPDETAKSELSVAFADVVDAELRAFNVERLYGGEVSPVDVVDAARTLPMMSERRVVVVLQAERVLQPKRESEAAAEALGALESYIQSPVPSTVLVLTTGEELNRQRRIARLLVKHATTVECGGIASPAEGARFINERARERGMSVDRAAVARLLAMAGADGARLRADLDRVLLYVGQGTVTSDDVDAVVAAAAVPGDDWALARAVERGETAAALRALRGRLEAGDSVHAIVGQLAWVVRQPPPRGRFRPERVRSAVDALFRTDVALKTSGGDPRVLVERLIVELCG